MDEAPEGGTRRGGRGGLGGRESFENSSGTARHTGCEKVFLIGWGKASIVYGRNSDAGLPPPSHPVMRREGRRCRIPPYLPSPPVLAHRFSPSRLPRHTTLPGVEHAATPCGIPKCWPVGGALRGRGGG